MSPIDSAVLERHGLKPERVRPHRPCSSAASRTMTELGIFSVMWSEHCSYKSSRIHLRKLPTQGPRVLQGPGENAGAVDIGDGLAAVFKIESHNHPSFIEPYQGAATGVGGIIRDIFTMGARPIALLNSLRFGALDGAEARARGASSKAWSPASAATATASASRPSAARSRSTTSYAGNPLVNVFCLGIADADELVKGSASGVGNPVYYVGAKTGRDGIHGATMASAEFDDKSAEKRPAVQVGDPFMEKLLLEACLELMQTDALVGMQDMGAAGPDLLDLRNGVARRRRHRDRRHARAAARDRHDAVRDHAVRIAGADAARRQEGPRGGSRADLREVGPARGAHRRRHQRRHACASRITARSSPRCRTRALVDEAPVYDRPTARPAYLDDVAARSTSASLPAGGVARDALLRAARVADHRQQAVGLPAVRPHGPHQHDRAAGHRRRRRPRSRGPTRALALSADGNGRYCYLDPRRGAMLAVAEAARNVACAGGDADRRHQLPELRQPGAPRDHVAVGRSGRRHRRGLPRARRAGHRRQRQPLQRDRRRGDLPDAGHRRGRRRSTMRRRVVGRGRSSAAGDDIILLGENRGELGGSEYPEGRARHGDGRRRRGWTSKREKRAAWRCWSRCRGAGLLASAHDCSDGGLAVTLAECAFDTGGIGVDVEPAAARTLSTRCCDAVRRVGVARRRVG